MNPSSLETIASRLAALVQMSPKELAAHLSSIPDIEFDTQGQIVGWGITLAPTQHHFLLAEHQVREQAPTPDATRGSRHGMVADRSAPHTWHMVEALQCETTDDTYAWLHTVLAVWDGECDMTTSRHRSHAYTSSDTQRVIT